MRRLLGTDRGRARLLLYGLILIGGLGLVWLTTQSYAVYKLTRGVGDTWFHAADGKPWFRLDEQRHDVPIAAISPHLQHAFVAVEDHRFFLHPGVDPIALGRAVVRNVREPGTVEGGSTITQQLARTLFLSNRRSYAPQGARGRARACSSRPQLTKQQILELYLNRIFLGAGIYGVEAMSQRVFGKPAKDLSIAESALIAGLARAPATLSPWSNLDGAIDAQPRRAGADARRRIHHARRRSARRGGRGSACAPIAAIATAGTATPRRTSGSGSATRSAAITRPTGASTPPSSLALQDAAERAVESGLRRTGKPDAAGGAGRHRSGYRQRARAGRRARLSAIGVQSRQPQPASAGIGVQAVRVRGRARARIVAGVDPARPRMRIQPQGPDEWTPRNVRDDAPDDIDAARGAASNRTIAPPRCCSSRWARGGCCSWHHEAGLEDLARRPVAGARHRAGDAAGADRGVRGVSERRASPCGRATSRACAMPTVARRCEQAVEVERVISPEVAFQMVSMLERRDRSRHRRAGHGGLASASRPAARPEPPTTSRTRGSSASRSSVVAGVWVGFDQPETIGRDAYGARYALPIWADFMQRAARVRPPGDFERPAGLQEETLCAISYLKPVDGCPIYSEFFKEGDQVPGPPVPAPSRLGPPARHTDGGRVGGRTRASRARHLPLTSPTRRAATALPRCGSAIAGRRCRRGSSR